MNRRKDLLCVLAERKPCEGLNLSQAEIQSVFDMLIDYYEIRDMETNDVHAGIFKALYVDGGFKNYNKVAADYYISSYTLDRYRQRYNRLAERLIKKILKYQGENK